MESQNTKNYNFLHKIIFSILFVEIILIGYNFSFLINKMSYDICGERCQIREFTKNDKSYLKGKISDSIKISKINVRAPIIFNSGISEQEILNNLNEGVVYYSSSNLPSESGLTLLFGHSSSHWWVDSEFNNIFSLIPELEVGDNIEVYYQGRENKYLVTGNKIINSSQWNEIKNPGNNSGLALVTCWPLGTDLKRFVVFAKKEN